MNIVATINTVEVNVMSYIGICIATFITIWVSNWIYRWRNPKCISGVLPPGSMGLPFLGETIQFFRPNPTCDVSPFIKKREKRKMALINGNDISPTSTGEGEICRLFIVLKKGREKMETFITPLKQFIIALKMMVTPDSTWLKGIILLLEQVENALNVWIVLLKLMEDQDSTVLKVFILLTILVFNLWQVIILYKMIAVLLQFFV